MVINKIDKVPREEILKKIDEYKDLYNFDEIIPISAKKMDNVDRLINVLKSKLTDNIKYYDEDMYTDKPVNFMVSELIREKILDLTFEEVPHSVSVIVDAMEYSAVTSFTASNACCGTISESTLSISNLLKYS